MDFSIGFIIDREKLAKYMATQNEFQCLLETSFGYTGVNIKIPLDINIEELKIKKAICVNGVWEDIITTFGEYIKKLPAKEAEKQLNKKRFTTFLCFHSGRIIVSSMNDETTLAPYEYFLKMIRKCYDDIEERLDV